MTKIITVQSAERKTSKTGTPWLSVKDTQGNSYSVWEQILFHLFTPQAQLEVSIVQNGTFVNITDVMSDGDAVAENVSDRPQPPKEKTNGEKIFEALEFIKDQNSEILEKLKKAENNLEGVN